MSRHFSLKWNSHYSALLGFFSSSREKKRFSDATIACNGKLYPVHQFVLSVCSDYFNAIFEGLAGDCTNAQRHPVLILRDISSTTLEALLCYMYLGEVTVEQQNLTELVMAAKSFQVKGLSAMDKESTPDFTHQNATDKFMQENTTSDYVRDAPDTAYNGCRSNKDQCIASISSESNLNRFSIVEGTLDKHCDEEFLSKEPFDGRDKRWEQVHGLDGLHDDSDSGTTPAATEQPPIDDTGCRCDCDTTPAATEQSPMDSTVSINSVTQGYCSCNSYPVVSVKLEPGIETMQTLGFEMATPPSATLDQGTTEFSAPLASTKSSPQLPMDTNFSPLPHSLESTNNKFCSGVHSAEFVRTNRPTSVDASCSCSMNCIPAVQLQTGANDDESKHLESGDPSSSASHISMPVIKDSYSLFQSETTGIHMADHIPAALMTQPRKTPTSQEFLPFNSSENAPMENTSHEENKGRSCLHPLKAADSNLYTNLNVIPSNFEHDDEFQELKWTVPTLNAYQRSSDHISHDERSVSKNCAPDERKKFFRCNYCSYRTYWKKFFLRHQLLRCPHRKRARQNRQPEVSKNFVCTLCEHSASSSCNLKNHLLMHNSKKMLQCPLCSYSTDKDYWLKTHVSKDHGSQSKSAIKLFLPSTSYKKKKAGNNDNIQTNSTPTKENYQCELCHFSFQKNNCFLEHKRIHCEPNNVKCPDCDYHTLFLFNMKKHTNIPFRGLFKCEFCSYTACTGSLMAKHAKLDQVKLTPSKSEN